MDPETRQFLEEFRAEFRGELEEARAEFRAELKEFRAEFRAELKEFRAEFGEFRAEVNTRFDEASAERELMWGVLVENTRQQHRTLKEAKEAASREAPKAPVKKRGRARGGRSSSAPPLAARDS